MAKTAHLNLRVSVEDRDAIQARADAAGMSVTAYAVAACLGRLPASSNQLDRIEAAVTKLAARLEQDA